VSVLYFALQAVAVAVLPELASAERPLVDAGDALFGPTGVLAMTVAVAASVGGNLAGAFFSTPRITYALALDRRLPGFFAAVPMRLGTPAVSIAVYGAAAFLLAAAGSFVWLASLSVLTRVLIYLGCITALPSLRRRASGVPGEFRLPGGLLIPALAAIVCVGLLTQVKPWDVLAVALLLAVGSVLYVVARLDDRT
jgi:amino acid transporter